MPLCPTERHCHELSSADKQTRQHYPLLSPGLPSGELSELSEVSEVSEGSEGSEGLRV